MGEVPLFKPRTLAVVVAEILLDDARLKMLMNSTRGRAPRPDEDAAWTLLENRLSANRKEAKRMIATDMGVDWEDLAGALA